MGYERTVKDNKNIEDTSAIEFPGVAINDADDDKVSKKLVEERTCVINNNPRNSEK